MFGCLRLQLGKNEGKELDTGWLCMTSQFQVLNTVNKVVNNLFKNTFKSNVVTGSTGECFEINFPF